MDKKLRYALMDIMENEENLEQEFVIDLIKKRAPLIDVDVLKEKEYKRMANSLISSFKDEKGIRDVFVIKNDEDMTAYINVARSKEIDNLNKVRERLDSNVKGNQKSLDKVTRRLFLLENQVTIAEIAETN